MPRLKESFELMRRLFESFATKAIDWWFRVSVIERFLITTAAGLLIAIFGGVPLIAELLRIAIGAVPEGYLNAQGKIDAVAGWILGIGFLMIVVGLGIAIARFTGDAKSRSKKRIIVIEGRGLRDDDGAPLDGTVGKQVEGQIVPVLLDLRRRMDGKVIEPERALDDIAAAHRSVLQHRRGIDRNDLTVVYGGLTSVPYTFLTGLLLDDEGDIKTYDWDRTQEAWRDLEGDDDGLSLAINGIDALSNSNEAVLSVAFSYPVDDNDLQSTFPHPVVRLTLDGMSSDAHWSQAKQNRLAQEFLEVVKRLSAAGVKRIHLVMAAPNSAVFTFGRRYDKRNLPEVAVYQFERGKKPAYPWAVLMPVAGIDRPEILNQSGNGGGDAG